MTINWTGDLDDDCTAHWRGLCLRAECMGCDDYDCNEEHCDHGEIWWWAVYRGRDEIAASHDKGNPGISGANARWLCESAAREILRGTP